MECKAHQEGAREVALLKKKAMEVSVYLENLGFTAARYPEIHDSLYMIESQLDNIHELIHQPSA